MDELISDTLMLARGGRDVTDEDLIPVHELSVSCWEMIQAPAAELTVSGEFTIIGDSVRTRQILENLFRNSVQHGGPSVSIRVGPLDEMRISNRIRPEAGIDGFYVEDDGPGIPAGNRDRIFEAGETTDEDGTGFGLAIVEEIVTAHGWDIAVTEGTNGGARFEITGVETPDDG